MKLAKVDRSYTSLLELSDTTKGIIWTNRYDCPPGHEFNDDGWIETIIPYPKITVNILPHLLRRLGEYQLLLQNLLALRLLNNKPQVELETALRNRFRQAFFGRSVTEEVFQEVIEASKKINETSELPVLCDDILRMDTIWFSKDCTEGGRNAIKKKLRNSYISGVRAMMSIATRYKTKEVMDETESSRYAVNSYWENLGLDAKNRTISAIIEAIEEIVDQEVELTQEIISIVAGVSIRSIQRYKDMWMLNDNNEREDNY